MVGTKPRILAAMAVIGLAAACDQPGPLVPVDDAPVVAAVTIPTAAQPNEVWVCKDAPAGDFSFTVSLSDATPDATVHQANPTIAANTCTKVASGGGAKVSIVESDPDPYILDKIEVYQIPLLRPTARELVEADFPNDGTPVMYGDRGLVFVFYNVSPPSTGCTLTQGYWKTHNNTFEGGASKKADPTWALVGPLAEGETFYKSGHSWYEVFWTSVGGNPYYSLAHQYMAAWLNVQAGADPTAVADELADAVTLLTTYSPFDVATIRENDKKSPTLKWFKDTASVLDDYNNGLIGPGHCGDVPI